MNGRTSPTAKHMAHIKGIVEVVCTMRGTDAQERVRVANVCKEAIVNFQTVSSGSVRLDDGITGDLEVFNSEGYVVVKGPCVQVLDLDQRPVSSQMAQDISTIAALRDSNGLLVIIGKCQLRNKRVAVVLDMFSDQRADFVIDDYQKFKDRRQEEAKSGQQEANMNNSSKDGYQGDISKIQIKIANEPFASNVKHHRAFVIEGFPTEMDTAQLKYAFPEDKRTFIHEIQRINNNENPSSNVCLIWKSFDQSPSDTLTLHYDIGESLTLTLKEVEQLTCLKCLLLGLESCHCNEQDISLSSERDKENETCAEDLLQDKNIHIVMGSAKGERACANRKLGSELAINELHDKAQDAERKANEVRYCNEINFTYEEYQRILLENEQMRQHLDSYAKRVQELESMVNELQEAIAPVSCTKSEDENLQRKTTTESDQKEELGRCIVS